MIKKEDNPTVKNYTYGGRVADGSMEKRHDRNDVMLSMPQNAYTTKQAEQAKEDERKKAMAATLTRLMS